MRLHDLKIQPKYLDAIQSGAKRFEIRKNDRGFRAGDYLHLREWHPDTAPGGEGYGGRECIVRVTYMTDFQQQPGFVVLGISDPI